MSWDEEEDFQPPAVINAAVAGQWDDEDKEDDVKDDWEQEDKPEEPAPAAAPGEPKTYAKTSTKKKRGKQIELKEAAKQREIEEANRKPLTFEEKQARQKQVEASDFENTKDVFGDNEALFGDDNVATSNEGATVDSFKPSNEKHFLKFATLISERVKTYEESFHYPNFVKALLKEITSAMDPEEIKELVTSLNVISNEKIAASKKKKPAPKKKGPVVQKSLLHEDMGKSDDYDIFS